MAIKSVDGDFFDNGGGDNYGQMKDFGFGASLGYESHPANPPFAGDKPTSGPHTSVQTTPAYAHGGMHHVHPHGHKPVHVERGRDGTVIHHHAHGGKSVHHADGHITHHFADGGMMTPNVSPMAGPNPGSIMKVGEGNPIMQVTPPNNIMRVGPGTSPNVNPGNTIMQVHPDGGAPPPGFEPGHRGFGAEPVMMSHGGHVGGHPHGHHVTHTAMHGDAVVHHHAHGGFSMQHPDGSMTHHDAEGHACGGSAHSYAHGGDVEQDKGLIKKAFHQHDEQEHPGEHTDLKLAMGGRKPHLPRAMMPKAKSFHPLGEESAVNQPPKNPMRAKSPRNAMPGGQMPYGVEPSSEPDQAGMDQNIPQLGRGGHVRRKR